MASPIATAADYADAMFVARRAKNALVAAILAILALQILLFLLARFTGSFRTVITTPTPAAAVFAPPTTAPSADTPSPTPAQPLRTRLLRQFLEYLVILEDFLGILLALVLVVVLLLMLLIMLVGRLIGVSHVTTAFLWSVVLVFLLFPWMAVGANTDLTTAEFRIPGTLYTWSELTHYANFQTGGDINQAILKWSRFVIVPLIAGIILLIVHNRSRRGLRMALGELPPPEGLDIQDTPPESP